MPEGAGEDALDLQADQEVTEAMVALRERAPDALDRRCYRQPRPNGDAATAARQIRVDR